MAEVLVEDFFAGEGGAADDATDCTAAMSAAIDAAMATDGGTVVMPTGICRIGEITRLFAGVEGTYKIRGSGGSVIRFQGLGYDRFYLGTAPTFIWEDINFFGNTATGAPWEEAQNAVFEMVGIYHTIFRRCNFVKMGSAVATGKGIVYSHAGLLSIEDCGFWGVFGGGGIVNGVESHGISLKRCMFLDYGNFGGEYMSKTPLGNNNWVRMTNSPQTNAGATSKLNLENCRFDEGAQAGAVYTDGIRYVEANGCSTNANFFGGGTQGNWQFNDALDVDLKNCYWGYNPNSPNTAVKATDVGRLKVEGSYLQAGVNRIELAGTTRIGEFINNRVGGQEGGGTEGEMNTSHIINTAGAIISVNGIKSKGGIAQIG